MDGSGNGHDECIEAISCLACMVIHVAEQEKIQIRIGRPQLD